MGRNKTYYKKDLKEQAHDALVAKLAPGESRHEAKLDGTAQDKIFSYGTYKIYRRQCGYFVDWIRETYPNCTTLKNARKHRNEWLASLVDNNYSAWTVHTASSALNKLYAIKLDDPSRFIPPPRRRCDIKRSRYPVANDAAISMEKYGDMFAFVQATGLRRDVMTRLVGDDLWSRDRMMQVLEMLNDKGDLTRDEKRLRRSLREALDVFQGYDYFIHHRRDKGGRGRLSPILPAYETQVIDRMRQVGSDERVWPSLHATADIHSYRAAYATAIYNRHARDIADIPYDKINQGSGYQYQSQVYVCRNDARGRKLDKGAMYICSKALGHNRIGIVASSYIRTTE